MSPLNYPRRGPSVQPATGHDPTGREHVDAGRLDASNVRRAPTCADTRPLRFTPAGPHAGRPLFPPAHRGRAPSISTRARRGDAERAPDRLTGPVSCVLDTVCVFAGPRKAAGARGTGGQDRQLPSRRPRPGPSAAATKGRAAALTGWRLTRRRSAGSWPDRWRLWKPLWRGPRGWRRVQRVEILGPTRLERESPQQRPAVACGDRPAVRGRGHDARHLPGGGRRARALTPAPPRSSRRGDGCGDLRSTTRPARETGWSPFAPVCVRGGVGNPATSRRGRAGRTWGGDEKPSG